MTKTTTKHNATSSVITPPRKILLVQIGHYGDMVLLTPAIKWLHQSFPEAELHLLAAERNHAIISTNPYIRRVLVYRKRLWSAVHLLATLRRERYDLWIDPKDHASRESTMFARLSGAAVRVGCNHLHKAAFTIALPDAEQNNAKRLHVIERNLQAVQAAFPTVDVRSAPNANVSSARPELFCDAESEALVNSWLMARLGDALDDTQTERGAIQVLVANISAGDASRYWREESWIQCVQAITSTLPLVRVVLNAVAADAPLAGRIARASGAMVFPSRSIHDAVSLIKRATLLLSLDTAAIHIAAAFDVPTIGLYNALEWNAHKFAPRSSRSVVLQPPVGREYVQDIEPERVAQAAFRLLSQTHNPSTL
jgi:ADP-heptose:LPS heptosyltransferase